MLERMGLKEAAQNLEEGMRGPSPEEVEAAKQFLSKYEKYPGGVRVSGAQPYEKAYDDAVKAVHSERALQVALLSLRESGEELEEASWSFKAAGPDNRKGPVQLRREKVQKLKNRLKHLYDEREYHQSEGDGAYVAKTTEQIKDVEAKIAELSKGLSEAELKNPEKADLDDDGIIDFTSDLVSFYKNNNITPVIESDFSTPEKLDSVYGFLENER